MSGVCVLLTISMQHDYIDPTKSNQEYELLTDRRIGFLAGMIGKMANRKLSLTAAQPSLALNASGMSCYHRA